MGKVYAEESCSNFCCGLWELGDFSEDEDGTWGESTDDDVRTMAHYRETALIATTIPRQKAAIAALKANKFKPLRRFKGSHGDMITLWYLAPKRKR